MMKSLAVGVVIGGAVAGSFNRMLGDVKSGMDGLRGKADNVKIWQKTISETQALQRQMGMLQGVSGRAFDDTKRKLEAHTAKLQAAKINVGNLTGEYERLGRVVKGLDLQMRGQAQYAAGLAQFGEGSRTMLATGAAAGLLTSKSANYQAELRDIGIKAGFNYQKDGAEREAEMGRQISRAASDNGMDETALAKAVNDLVAGGMGVQEALSYAALAAKTTVGQKAEATDVTKMMGTISSTLGITTREEMQKALGILAVQGKAGKFEFNAMARYLPNLATDFANLGMQGEEAVRGLGAAFQVMRMGAGTDEEAAGNLKNWLGKIGSGETIKNYKDVGINYEGEMLQQAKAGRNPFEASLELARQYIEKTDAATANRLKAAANEAATITDQAKRDEYVKKLESTFQTGDLFADMQVKSALAAYLQNRDKYQEIRDAKGSDTVLDDDLAARRATSAQKWGEAQNAFSKALRNLGDSIAPATDLAADALRWLATGVGELASEFKPLSGLVLGAVAAFAAWKTAAGAWKVGKGALDVLRGKSLAGKGVLPDLLGQVGDALDGGVQKVFVVNMPGSGFGGDGLPDGPDSGDKSKKPGKSGKPATRPKGRLGRLGNALRGAGGTLKNVAGTALDYGKGLAGRVPTLGTAALTAGRTWLAGMGAGSATAGAGTLAGSAGLVGAAGLAGYGAGTLAYDHAIAGTGFGDMIGRGISKTLAFFGNQEAQDALAREERYEAAQAGKPLPAAALPEDLSPRRREAAREKAELRALAAQADPTGSGKPFRRRLVRGELVPEGRPVPAEDRENAPLAALKPAVLGTALAGGLAMPAVAQPLRPQLEPLAGDLAPLVQPVRREVGALPQVPAALAAPMDSRLLETVAALRATAPAASGQPERPAEPGIKIDYAPVFHLPAGTPEDVKRAVTDGAQQGYEEFKRMYERYLAERSRRAF